MANALYFYKDILLTRLSSYLNKINDVSKGIDKTEKLISLRKIGG